MRFTLLALKVVVCGLLLTLSQPASADIVGFDFTGNVIGNFGNPLGITSPIGDPVSGSFSYDTTVSDTNANGQIGTYLQSQPQGINVAVGGLSLVGLNDAINIGNNAPVDYFNYFSQFNANVNGVTNNSTIFGLFLVDVTGALYANDSLPSNLNLANFNFNIGFIFDVANNGLLLFQINGLTAHTPEPASLAVWSVVGLAGMVFARRRRGDGAASENRAV